MQNNAEKQNPILFYLQLFLYMLLALAVRVAALAPLAVLFLVDAGSKLCYAALLSPLLILFVVLPLRNSFADAIVQVRGHREFHMGKAFSFANYGQKLKEAFIHALSVLKWGIPVFALLGAAAYYFLKNYSGSAASFAFKALTDLSALTGKAKDICYAVINFFVKLFGGEALTYPAPTINDAFTAVLIVLGIALLIWSFGAMRNSASRYIWVLAIRDNHPPRRKIRHHLSHRRWSQFGKAMINLLFFVPFLYFVSTVVLDKIVPAISGMIGALALAKITGKLDYSMLVDACKASLKPLAIYFAALYLPFLPARRWNTCHFATRYLHHHHHHSEETQPIVAHASDAGDLNPFRMPAPPTHNGDMSVPGNPFNSGTPSHGMESASSGTLQIPAVSSNQTVTPPLPDISASIDHRTESIPEPVTSAPAPMNAEQGSEAAPRRRRYKGSNAGTIEAEQNTVQQQNPPSLPMGQ